VFPDLPRCEVTGGREEEVVAQAPEALIRWLRECLVKGAAPAPRRRYAGPGQAVSVPKDIAFAIELRDAREKAVLFRHELAQRAGVSVALVDPLETARTPATLDRVLPIAKALGMRPSSSSWQPLPIVAAASSYGQVHDIAASPRPGPVATSRGKRTSSPERVALDRPSHQGVAPERAMRATMVIAIGAGRPRPSCTGPWPNACARRSRTSRFPRPCFRSHR
jgi:transcriptional regulator with XRE-family HTH domain